MPAKKHCHVDKEGVYFHIYNKGIDHKHIFNDASDYEVFLSYLNDYLTTPKDPTELKKTFRVGNQTFQGIPHQPKNYLNQIDLIAYSLNPNHFHLIIRQKTKDSVEKFIRSLSTRYSMYFNKKYNRSGSLFKGPYKSISIATDIRAAHLTRYLHHHSDHCSYPEYLGSRKTPWVKKENILALFDKGNSYKTFVEKYESDQKGQEAIKDIAIEDITEHLIKEVDQKQNELPPHPKEQALPTLESYPQFRSRLPELLVGSLAIFVLLVTLGVRNITASGTNFPLVSISPAMDVLSATKELLPTTIPEMPPQITSQAQMETPIEATAPANPETNEATSSANLETPEATASAIPQQILIIKAPKGFSSINIRQEPTTKSEIISEAQDGDIFEFMSLNAGWYEIKLPDGSTGFITSKNTYKQSEGKL